LKISVIGTGYVGTVTAACFADLGHTVICVDIDEERVRMINDGIPPIQEDGLKELLQKHSSKNLVATSDYDHATKNSDVSFICVGTPLDANGKIDLSIVKNASRSIGEALKNKAGYHVIAVKSTVVPETTQNVIMPIIEEHSQKKAGADFGIVMNPEFLREGMAIHDFMHPDRIVIGELDKQSGDAVAQLYKNFNAPLIRTNLKTAEMIKYASNAFLATKISFSNEIGNMCKMLGIDVYDVMHAVGLDHRISPHFLRAGVGFGGSCFPKDVKALIHNAEELGYQPKLLKSVMDVNEEQPKRMIQLLERKVFSLKGKKVAILGLAFKDDTDDIRDSRAIPVIQMLLEKNVKVSAYDPLANENMRRVLPDIEYCTSPRDALRDADACLVMTEWDEFKKLDDEFKVMKNRIVIDGRNIITPREHIDYEGLCW